MNTNTQSAPIVKAKKAQSAKIVKTPQGLSVASNVKGADIIKAKKQSELMLAKYEANNSHKAKISTLSFILSSVKDNAVKYVDLLNVKYECKVTMEQLTSIKPSQFVTLMSDKEKERQANNGNKWGFYLVLTLISRYYKAQK
jgi:hypothetical protein